MKTAELFPSKMTHYIVITHTTWKLKVLLRYCTYWATILLLEISILRVRAVCELQSASYSVWIQTLIATAFWDSIFPYLQSKLKNYRSYMDILHTEWLLCYQRCLISALKLDARYEWWVIASNSHRSLFSISYLCLLRHITWKLLVICRRSVYRTTAILSEPLFLWFRVALEIWLENYNPRHPLVVLRFHIVCVYCKCLHTSLFGVQVHMTAKLTYLTTGYYTPSDGHTANDASI